MKKIILIASLLFALTGISFAQTTPAKTDAGKTTTHVKKDGTPDKRFKENKDAAKAKPATTHVKKDGTPDKRYKENKPAKSGK
ncbi:MAG TPA: hypothetical protein VMT76_09050 [Puia sp.]|nr:hypothetical protein [Puia sp.]